MADPTPTDDRGKAAQSEVPSILPAKRDKKDEVTIYDEGARQDADTPIKPWRIREALEKSWNFAKKPESANVAMAIATIVIALATVFT